VRGKPLVYLDNAATSQKPLAVLEALDRYYRETNANVHRGVHLLSQEATLAFEAARERVRRFLGAASEKEIVFTRGTTEAINLVAQTWGRANVKAGDEIVLTTMEHHSNIVPWQMLAKATGAVIRVVPIDDSGALDLAAYERLLSPRTRLVAAVHVSNALGTVNPVPTLVAGARRVGAKVLIDGAQAVPHLAVDVRALDVDFYALSAHKVYGPTGIGVLYGKQALLEAMEPWQGGGDMIRSVSFEETTWNDLPYKFEAGTPDIAGGIGLGAALEWLEGVGLAEAAAHEARCSPTAPRRCARSPPCVWSAPRLTRPPCSPSRWRGCIPTTSGPCSTSRASRCARGTTAPSRSWPASPSRRRPGRRSRSTTAPRTSMPSSPPSTR
jgi:cysteine desulfurase/selenocysteine lyase